MAAIKAVTPATSQYYITVNHQCKRATNVYKLWMYSIACDCLTLLGYICSRTAESLASLIKQLGSFLPALGWIKSALIPHPKRESSSFPTLTTRPALGSTSFVERDSRQDPYIGSTVAWRWGKKGATAILGLRFMVYAHWQMGPQGTKG